MGDVNELKQLLENINKELGAKIDALVAKLEEKDKKSLFWKIKSLNWKIKFHLMIENMNYSYVN